MEPKYFKAIASETKQSLDCFSFPHDFYRRNLELNLNVNFHEIMKPTNFKCIAISSLSGLVLISSLSAMAPKPAYADLFEDLKNTANQIDGQIKNAKDLHGSVVSAVGNLSELSKSLGLSPQAQSTDLLDIYSSWYGSITASDKEVVKALITEYAEDKELSFSTFNKSASYTDMSPLAQSQARSIFFKFKEVTVNATPIKNKFLAFAFCLSDGLKQCSK
jgi:hypothetical protein